jgi:hypothetical protein
MRERVLWIDALCIDQLSDGEDGEKSHQLHLMGAIYREAHRTIAWVGAPSSQTEGIQILADFLGRLVRIGKRMNLSDTPIASFGATARHISPAERQQFGVPDDNHGGWYAFKALLRLPYMRRVWIVQECALAQEVIMQCGPHHFLLEDVGEAWSIMWTLNLGPIADTSTVFKALWTERTRQKRGEKSALLPLVVRHWLSDATKKQDKIYALCGLASDAGADGLNIAFNYQQPVEVVYTRFAQAALAHYRNLDIFSTLTPFHSSRSKALPSWVPDWRHFQDNTFLYRRPELPPDTGPCLILFTAAKCTDADPIFDRSGARVRLNGFVLDTIEELGDARPATQTRAQSVNNLVSWRNNVALCPSVKKYAHTGQEMVDVFYHCLTMANISNFLNNPLEQYQTFDEALLSMYVKYNYTNDIKKIARSGKARWEDIGESVVLSASRPAVNRRMARTESRYLGLVPGQARKGDKIALMRGGATPIVIRKFGNDWQVLGDAYLHGVMMGEAFDESKCEPLWFV